MPLSTTIGVTTPNGLIHLQVNAGSTVVFIGANGAGKTRLGVNIDRQLSSRGIEVHRIAAHRSLNLNPNVIPPNLETATNRLLYGLDQGGHQNKHGHRYQNKPETMLLNDFDHLLAALYADNNNVSIEFRQQCIITPTSSAAPPPAKIDKLIEIWKKLLPHRELVTKSGNIKTKDIGGQEYSASDMSDGERVIFYLIGQALLAKPDTLLIFDEPELHINRAILVKLWDEIESLRSDCSFLYITHDVEFAASRHAAIKYALRSYQKIPNEAWDIEIIPDEDDFPDDIIASIIGSRRPILFVEGDGGSLDVSLYRRVYAGFTVIPIGSCDRVIHTVASFAARPELHRVGCAGIVDADGRTDSEAVYLERRGVYRLPVSEVENLLLLPDIFKALAKALNFAPEPSERMLSELKEFVFCQAKNMIDEICVRYTRRRIDAEMKKIGLNSSGIEGLELEFSNSISAINVKEIFNEIKAKLLEAIDGVNYETVLLYYDNKGLLAEAAKKLGYGQKGLEQFIGRTLRSGDAPDLRDAMISYLPHVIPRP